MARTGGPPRESSLRRVSSKALPWVRGFFLAVLAVALLRTGPLRTEPASGGGEDAVADATAPFGAVWFLDCGFPRQCRLVTDDGEWIVIADESGNRLLEFAVEGASLLADPPRRLLPPDGSVRLEGTVVKGARPLPAAFPFPATPTPTAPAGSTPTPTPTPHETPTRTHY